MGLRLGSTVVNGHLTRAFLLALLCALGTCHDNGSTLRGFRVPASVSSILAQQQQQSIPQAPAAAAATAAPSTIDPKYKLMFDLHNTHRAAHGVSFLAWDDALAADAAAHAQQCVWGHNADELITKFQGENLAFSQGVTEDEALQTAIKTWYSEEANYDYNNPGTAKPNTTGEIEHFTQMVWKATTTLGCAINFCPTLGPHTAAWFTVCRYYIMGNWDGDDGHYWSQNVLPVIPVEIIAPITMPSPVPIEPIPHPDNPDQSPKPSPSPVQNPSPSPAPQNPDEGLGLSPSPSPAPQIPDSPAPQNPSRPRTPKTPAGPPGLVLPSSPMTDNMAEGVFMQAPACIASPNGRYKFCLLLQKRPQLVLLAGNKVAWKRMMPAGSKAPFHIYLYPDGYVSNANLVVKNGSGQVVWSVPRKSGQKSPYLLKISNTGSLVLSGAGRAIWSLKA